MQRLAWLYAPPADAVMFALRLCIAMAAALYLSMWLQLDRPYWAALEVAVMMQPIPGMAVVRGFARTIGTIIAGCVGLVIVAFFAQSLVLSAVALALWVSLCSFFASLFRNNLSYGFAIAGFLTGITVVLSHTLNQPPFQIALARTSECVLAAIVASVVNVLLTPPIAARGYFSERIQLLQALGDELARLAAPETGAGTDASADDDPHAALNALARQALALEQKRRYAVYESPRFGNFNRLARHLDYDLLALISSISSLHIYIANRAGTIDTEALGELQEPAEMMRHHPEQPLRIKQSLDDAYERMFARAKAPDVGQGRERRLADWAVLSRALDLASRLRGAIVKHDLLIAERWQPTGDDESIRTRFSRSVDVKHALRNALRTLVAVSIGATIWVNFHDQLPAVLVLILLSALTTILATVPNPVAAAGGFGKGLAVAAVAAFVVDFFFIPQATGFAMLMLCILPVVFLGGLAMATPSPTVALPGRISIVMFSILVHVQNSATPAFTTYIQILLGISMAVGLTMLSFNLILPVSPRQRLREQLAGVFDELTHGKRLSRPQFETRMYDRLNQLSMDIADGPIRFSARQAVMATLNIGLETRSLQLLAERAEFSRSVSDEIEDAVSELGRIFPVRRPRLDAIVSLQRQVHDLAERMIDEAVPIESLARRRLAIRAAVSAELLASALADYLLAFEMSRSAPIRLGALERPAAVEPG